MGNRVKFSRPYLTPILGILLCSASAVVMSIAYHESASGSSIPLVFLAVILSIALRFGSLAGILGSCAASLIFASCLFSPVGSIRISDQHNRSNVAWMLLGGVAFSFLLSSNIRGERRKIKTSDANK